jgi:hypothetical protein
MRGHILKVDIDALFYAKIIVSIKSHLDEEMLREFFSSFILIIREVRGELLPLFGWH